MICVNRCNYYGYELVVLLWEMGHKWQDLYNTFGAFADADGSLTESFVLIKKHA
jgi:hypothetical protein